MRPGIDTTGAAAPWMDSQNILIDPALTLGELSVVATFCLDLGEETDDLCYERTYNSVASHPTP